MKFYAVAIGRVPGVYTDWGECKNQITSFSGSQFKSFFSREEAEKYLEHKYNNKSKSDYIKDIPIHNKTKIYTDGSSKNGSGGYGIKIIQSDGKIIEYSGNVPDYTTNQRAELYAIKIAISESNGDLIIYTDSMYSIKSITEWHVDWKKNGWKNSKGASVKNQNLIKEILILSENRNIKYEHVRAHTGINENERADQLAKIGNKIFL